MNAGNAYATTYVKPVATGKAKNKPVRSSEDREGTGDKGGGQMDDRNNQSRGALEPYDDDE